MDVVAAIAVIGRATWRLLKFCNKCWRDTEKDDVDNDDYLNNSGTDVSGDSESEPERRKKSVASTERSLQKKRRTNIKKRRTASSSDFLKWNITSIENSVELIDTAVVGGYDIEENDLWIIRARFKGQIIPGMLNLWKNKAVVPNKREDSNVVKSVDKFEVLCISPESRNRIRWTKCSNGDVPRNAVEAGRTSADEKLYVGREIQEDEGHPGKGIMYPGMVQPSHGVLYVTYDNEVYAHNLYEVLCID